MHEIIPAILPKSEEDLKEKLSLLPAEITFFHIDVLEEDIWMENNRDFEVHLMVREPEQLMAKWIERGAKRLSVHTAGNSLAQFRSQAEIGLAVELDKSLEEVIPFLNFVDFVHLMSIDEIGEQGHALNEKVFGRIKTLQEKFPELPISVDGGVNVRNYQKLLELGADRLIVGAHFRELWNLLKTK
ncbi:MAG: hypothetical protein HYT69_00400 [Candidatus Zambryskibacteria bacterium]|nr:hypothetical protein [Candidatus Zambryskibacteria bacterium]